MGLGSPLYLENTFRFTLRIWNFLHENNIDTENHTPATLNQQYSNDLDELASGLGISMMQYDGAAKSAIQINENGFQHWYEGYMNNDPEKYIPTDNNALDRDWSLTITPSLEDNPYTDEKMAHSQTEQNLIQKGVDGTIEWINGIIEYAEENGANVETDTELQALITIKTQLENNEYEPAFAILPEE